MDALVEQLVSTVQAAGGSISWDALMESVSFQDRAKVPDALKIAKAQGKLKRNITFDAASKTNIHTVNYIGS